MADHHIKPQNPSIKDITGQHFGLCQVIAFERTQKGYSVWRCLCQCGNEFIAKGASLKNGDAQSCGCLKRSGRTYNARYTSEYGSWRSMVYRCTNPNCAQYDRYGGKGITVCERWRKFEFFLEDMGPKPALEHSIDRFPNPTGNYEPGNCRWATTIEQGRNKKSNRLLTFNGKTACVTEWAQALGISKSTLGARLRKGYSVEKALTMPVVQQCRW